MVEPTRYSDGPDVAGRVNCSAGKGSNRNAAQSPGRRYLFGPGLAPPLKLGKNRPVLLYKVRCLRNRDTNLSRNYITCQFRACLDRVSVGATVEVPSPFPHLGSPWIDHPRPFRLAQRNNTSSDTGLTACNRCDRGPRFGISSLKRICSTSPVRIQFCRKTQDSPVPRRS